jgi:hypothetical protein
VVDRIVALCVDHGAERSAEQGDLRPGGKRTVRLGDRSTKVAKHSLGTCSAKDSDRKREERKKLF